MRLIGQIFGDLHLSIWRTVPAVLKVILDPRSPFNDSYNCMLWSILDGDISSKKLTPRRIFPYEDQPFVGF